jgi:hypothetical protein
MELVTQERFELNGTHLSLVYAADDDDVNLLGSNTNTIKKNK